VCEAYESSGKVHAVQRVAIVALGLPHARQSSLMLCPCGSLGRRRCCCCSARSCVWRCVAISRSRVRRISFCHRARTTGSCTLASYSLLDSSVASSSSLTLLVEYECHVRAPGFTIVRGTSMRECDETPIERRARPSSSGAGERDAISKIQERASVSACW